MKATPALASAIAVLIALGSPVVSFSADAPKLRARDAMALAQALRELDGRKQVVKVNGQDTIVVTPWEFGSGSLRLRIANDLAILSAVEQQMTTIRAAIFREVTKGGSQTDIPPGSPEAAAFMKQFEDALNQPAAGTQDLARIKASELRLDRNEIMPSVLEGLRPILDQD
jgi:hypothetical protein